MRTVREVKEFLDILRERQAPGVVAEGWRLDSPGLSEADCQHVEQHLNVQLPSSYRDMLKAYNWSHLEFGYLKFFATANKLINTNQASANPLYEFYRAHHLLEIGHYEADRICIRLSNGSMGEIVSIPEAKYPNLITEFVASSFEKLVVCAALDLQLKMQSGYYDWSDEQMEQQEEQLYAQVWAKILQVEPRATESNFWHRFIRGI